MGNFMKYHVIGYGLDEVVDSEFFMDPTSRDIQFIEMLNPGSVCHVWYFAGIVREGNVIEVKGVIKDYYNYNKLIVN